ncbi:MAG: hypothetical protein J7K72_00680 [Candidatus Aenigmarchaeota archaeon]|nr:hypothetical protein [Candidatus Aenigmarchaeota archaeon]
MKAYVATNFLGVFAFNGNGKLVDFERFEKVPETVAQKIMDLSEGKIVHEEKKLLDRLIKSGVKKIIWDKKLEYPGIECFYERMHTGKEALRKYREISVREGIVKSDAELNKLLSNVCMYLTANKLKKMVRKDKIIMLIVGMIDELNNSLNNLVERLRELYGLHFPELSKAVKDHKKFAELVARYGERCNVKGFDSLAKKSVGMNFGKEDIKNTQRIARQVIELYTMKDAMSSYLEDVCKKTIPNMTAVAGHMLAARLLNIAGGLEKLAKLPSSTIQLLGAEKALFRHLKGEGKAPKYGVIFGHPFVQQAPKPLKGKIARLVASKLSLAAKMDFYSKKDQGEDMRKDLEKKIEEVLKEFKK